MNKLKKMFLKLRNKDYRLAFMSARVAAAIGGQISSMRKQKHWTQDELALHAGMKRSRISLLERADYEGFSFTTLKRIAAAFDVAVIIQFVSFGEFLKWSESFNHAALVPKSFAESARKFQDEDWSAQLKQLIIGGRQDGSRDGTVLPPLGGMGLAPKIPTLEKMLN